MEEAYYQTKESVAEYIRLAKDVNGKQLIEKLSKFLPVQSTVLELGSGPGTDWNILKENYNVVGSDNSTEFLNHLTISNPSGRFLELDATTLDTDEQFDSLYTNKVLHHLQDNELIDSVNRQVEVLNPNGVVCHSFWKGTGSEVFKGLFVNYHEKDSLKKLFEKHFDVLLIEDYQEFEAGDSILLIAKKR